MSAVGAVFLVAVLLIVLALVYFLVSTILALRKINAGLDTVIEHVGGIVSKSAPVEEVVTAINAQLDAGVELLEGLLVKKAGMTDAMGLIEGLYPTLQSGRVVELQATADAWLAANEDAHDALRRLVIEGRDNVRRALKNQAVDSAWGE